MRLLETNTARNDSTKIEDIYVESIDSLQCLKNIVPVAGSKGFVVKRSYSDFSFARELTDFLQTNSSKCVSTISVSLKP